MLERGKMDRDLVEFVAIDQLVPKEHLLRKISKISGIGENKLRELMDKGEIEYVQNGNRRLIAESAIWDWYNRNKVPAKASGGE